jgi:hypothetical protein
MSLKLPDLDDRRYEDLVDEARASIPHLHPGWTDHNPSDPGITLVELFAWLVEMVLYRVNRVTPQTYDVFLKLLNGPAWRRPEGQDLDSAVQESIQKLRERWRAVSSEDYEYLVAYQWPSQAASFPWPEGTAEADKQRIGRVHCMAERNFAAAQASRYARAPGHVSLLVVPDVAGAPWSQPSAALLSALQEFLNDRKILTTRLHVVGPGHVQARIQVTIYLKEDASPKDVLAQATNALKAYFHPLHGGRPVGAGFKPAPASDRAGWPLGRCVHASEVYSVLDAVRGMDFVKVDSIAHFRAGTPVTSSSLNEDELVQVDDAAVVLKALQKRRGQWKPISS